MTWATLEGPTLLKSPLNRNFPSATMTNLHWKTTMRLCCSKSWWTTNLTYLKTSQIRSTRCSGSSSSPTSCTRTWRDTSTSLRRWKCWCRPSPNWPKHSNLNKSRRNRPNYSFRDSLCTPLTCRTPLNPLKLPRNGRWKWARNSRSRWRKSASWIYQWRSTSRDWTT